MLSTIFVLIMWAHDSGAVTQEFGSRAACEHALEVLKESGMRWQYLQAICVPKEVTHDPAG